jgi:hypothetical protein
MRFEVRENPGRHDSLDNDNDKAMTLTAFSNGPV